METVNENSSSDLRENSFSFWLFGNFCEAVLSSQVKRNEPIRIISIKQVNTQQKIQFSPQQTPNAIQFEAFWMENNVPGHPDRLKIMNTRLVVATKITFFIRKRRRRLVAHRLATTNSGDGPNCRWFPFFVHSNERRIHLSSPWLPRLFLWFYFVPLSVLFCFFCYSILFSDRTMPAKDPAVKMESFFSCSPPSLIVLFFFPLFFSESTDC